MTGILCAAAGSFSSANQSTLTTVNTWASDNTLYGLTTNFGSQIASSATTFKGSTVTGTNNYNYTSPTITFNSSTMIGSNIVNVVWSNYTTTSNGNLVTNIINNGGKVIVLVFGAIAYSRSTYSITEQADLPTTYRLISSTGQTNLGSTTLTVQSQPWLGTSAGQSFNATGYYASSPTPSLLQSSAEVFLKDGSGNPYGAIYKSGQTSIAQIMFWPGSAFGFSNAPVSSSILVPLLARIALYMCT